MAYCEICEKTFCNKFSKDRHDFNFHENDDDSNSTDSSSMDSESDTESSLGYEGDEETELEDESDMEDSNGDTESEEDSEVDPMEQAIIETVDEYGNPEFGSNGELEEPELTRFIQKLEETVENVIDHAKQLKTSPLYQQIQKTAQRLKQKHDFSDDEARSYAWNKRRFLLKDVINDVTNNVPNGFNEDGGTE